MRHVEQAARGTEPERESALQQTREQNAWRPFRARNTIGAPRGRTIVCFAG